jgi:hypothetical protein
MLAHTLRFDCFEVTILGVKCLRNIRGLTFMDMTMVGDSRLCSSIGGSQRLSSMLSRVACSNLRG